jgi:chitin biosynthesis protein CHS5
MLVSLTVGKVDAGVAVLLTEDKRLVRTDSLLRWANKELMRA